jgi:HK97 family phage major capsid protein
MAQHGRNNELQRDLKIAESKREALIAERAKLFGKVRAGDGGAGDEERLVNLDRGIERLNNVMSEIADTGNRLERLRSLAEKPENIERTYEEIGREPSDRNPDRDAALRTIERFAGSRLRSEAADELDDLVRSRDPSGTDARYLTAVGDPAYNSAFGKLVTDPTHGHLKLDAGEVEAVRRVNDGMIMRAMSIGTGSAGGFAVPFQLDPTILLSSNGALNPIRQLARVITVSTDQWKGISSAGVVATYQAEAAAVTDASPTLAQPVIDCAMWRCFVPFSIELGADWSTLQQELTRLISDGRDVLDATQFLTGTGTDSPAGVLTGLSTSQRVQTAGAGAIAIGDIYALKQAVPARFMGNASWAAHPNRLDTIFRLTPAGSTTEPQAMPTRDGDLIGRPVTEWTTMATASTTGTKYALYGDFQAGFTIADRIGMTVELIPHLFGAAQGNLPTGQRGLFAYGRTGSKVVVPEALRYGEVL